MAFFLFSASNTHCQIISNLEWDYTDGIPDQYSIAKSRIDFSGNIVSVCSKLVTGQDANISLSKLSATGGLIWNQTFNGVSNAKDYAANLFIGPDNSIYVCGTTYDSTNHYDILVLKYDSAGNLVLTIQYDGPAHNGDVGAALNLDNNGYIYVCGMSSVTGNLTDFVTICYKPNGDFEWDTFYDYANGYEAPLDIQFNSGYSRVYVSGASATSATNWDYATIQYNLSGTQISATRSSSAGTGFDNPNGFCIDSLNNIYITGSVIDSGTTTYDIQTIKLDSALNILWVKTYDADAENDQGNDLAVDDYGNVYVLGQIKKSNDSANISILKYNASGDLIWSRDYGARDSLSSDKGKKIVISNNHILVTGEYEQSGNLNIITFQIDSSGNMIWCKFLDGEGNGYDSPTSLTVTDDDEVIVSGKSFDGTAIENITIKYSLLRVADLVVGYDTDSNKYVKGEVVVKFDPLLINDAFSDNIHWQHAKLEDIVADSVVTEMANMMSYENAGELAVIKIYDWMTKSDSLSIARNGDTIVMDKLWSTYRLMIPEAYQEEDITLALTAISNTVMYSHLNIIYEQDVIPDDTYIGYQEALIPNNFTVAHIKADGAWNIETGKPWVRIGVIDGGISYEHPEFGGGTLASSKIVAGEEFYYGLSLENYTFGARWHGTANAGIIAAIRNNNKGIAGVAGGNAQIGNPGSSIVSLACHILTTADVSNAIVKGATQTPQNGYYCNIINNTNSAHFVDLTMQDAVKSCFDNHCVFIASRGNRYLGEPEPKNYQVMYPSCFKKEWLLSVGGSGNNGGRKKLQFNGDNIYESMYDHNVDVVAPGSMDIVVSCQGGTNYGGGYAEGYFSPNYTEYTRFSGTSAAAPHVTGLAALMLSHHDVTLNQGYPNNLDDGDIQYLIKKYAHDVENEGTIEVGNGLIDAESTMQHIALEEGYWVQHSTSSLGGSYTLQTTAIGSGFDVDFSYDDLFGFPYNLPYSPFAYKGTLLQHTYLFTIPLPAFVSNPTIVDKWITHKSAIGPYSTIDFSYYGSITANISGNNIYATMVTYTWTLYADCYQNPFPPVIFPFDIGTLFPMISIQLYDPAIIPTGVATTLSAKNNLKLVVYPNPANDKLHASFECKQSSKVNAKMYNSFGQLIEVQRDKIAKPGKNELIFNTQNLAPGLYNILVNDNDVTETVNFVIQH